jgi:hypothetical protein
MPGKRILFDQGAKRLPKRRKLTPKDRAAIVGDYQDGLKIEAIGVDQGFIDDLCFHADFHGISVRSGRPAAR